VLYDDISLIHLRTFARQNQMIDAVPVVSSYHVYRLVIGILRVTHKGLFHLSYDAGKNRIDQDQAQ
jgi:hypothetical protein